MGDYEKYVTQLKRLLYCEETYDSDEITDALDGHAYLRLRSLIPIQTLRSSGAFFTSHELAEFLVERAKEHIPKGGIILDPACGAGNLLITAAKYLPLKRTLRATLIAWGKVLYGFDLHPEFVEATKIRLALLAKERGKFTFISEDYSDIFPNIRSLDALSPEASSTYTKASILLLNPPYQAIIAPNHCTWASGSVSAAAVFLDHLASHLEPKSKIYAILPEVLRCGSRYNSFRNELSIRLQLIYQKSVGIFDKWTDVDVFISEIRTKEYNKSARNILFVENQPTEETVGERFEVRVGPVVDFRSPKKGAWRLFCDTKNTIPWSTNFISTKHRRFSGTLFTPPFVVIRRNSRPDFSPRAIGTIVRGIEPVAVENHLIVLLPRKKTVKECIALLSLLRSSETNTHLNRFMRCRHLTVGVVKSIPWKNE